MSKKSIERIEGTLKINSVNEVKTALTMLITARATNHFRPAFNSSLAKYASKYPAGNAAIRIKMYNITILITYLKHCCLKSL